MADRTTLVIAHRLSTVQHADKIIVIANGVVQEVGNHEGLLAAGEVYATLVRRQLQRSGSTMSFSNPPGLEGPGSSNSIMGPRRGSHFTSQASLSGATEHVED
jgi:ABC-type multidrug transport system ATPase subunit